MTRKTYAARGLLDWQMALNVGGAIIRLCFSGGSMGTNGVIPAKYVTDNPVIQQLIEDSPQYKAKKVFLLQQENISKNKETEATKPEDDATDIPQRPLL